MARPIKQGIDYFPLDVVLDTKFELIEAEFGLNGFAVIVKLFQKIYGEQGYYCEWNDEVALLFARRNMVGVNVVSEILKAALKRGIFDKGMFEKFSILTSAGIQSRYIEAKRGNTQKINQEYLLLNSSKNSINATKTGVIATRTGVIVDNNPTKENKIKENNSIIVQQKWNELESYGIKTISKISTDTKRYNLLCARIKENGLENILKAIDKIKDSDFLQGKNNKGWAITFDWFVLPNNFIKVYEGNYNNRPTVEVKPKGIFNNYEQKIYSEGELEEILRRKGIR